MYLYAVCKAGPFGDDGSPPIHSCGLFEGDPHGVERLLDPMYLSAVCQAGAFGDDG